MIYLFIVILLLFMILRYDYFRNERGREMSFWIIYVLLVLVAGLRYRLGQDTAVYIRYYENLQPISQISISAINSSRFAPGFTLIASAFRQFTSEFVYFQLFHSIIVNTVFLLFLKRHTKHLFFSILLFFFFLYFNLLFQQMRESLAASVFLLAWPAFTHRNWILWYIAAIFAMMFHVSSVFMLLLPLINLPIIKNFFIYTKFTPLICVGFIILGFLIQAYLFKYIQLIAFTEAMMERATTYSHSDLARASFNILGLIGKAFQWIVYPLLALIFLFSKKFRTENRDNTRLRQLEKMAILSIYISSLCISIPILGRYNNYFYIFSIILMSQWVFTSLIVHGKKIRMEFASWMIFFLPMFFFQVNNTYIGAVNRSGTLKGYMVYYPYSSYLDKTMDEDREKTMRYLIRTIK